MAASDQGSGDQGIQVGIGARIEIELIDAEGSAEQVAFDLVADQAADFDAGYLGAGTALGKALVGHFAGAVVPYRMADIREVRILSVTPSIRKADPNAAAIRDAVAREAAARSDLEDTVRLALTFSSKWGDYDPEGIVPHDDHEGTVPEGRNED